MWVVVVSVYRNKKSLDCAIVDHNRGYYPVGNYLERIMSTLPNVPKELPRHSRQGRSSSHMLVKTCSNDWAHVGTVLRSQLLCNREHPWDLRLWCSSSGVESVAGC